MSNVLDIIKVIPKSNPRQIRICDENHSAFEKSGDFGIRSATPDGTVYDKTDVLSCPSLHQASNRKTDGLLSLIAQSHVRSSFQVPIPRPSCESYGTYRRLFYSRQTNELSRYTDTVPFFE